MPRAARVCEMCKVTYRPTYTKQRTCSRACGVALKRASRPPKPTPAPVWPSCRIYCKRCRECGSALVGRSSRPAFCPDCAKAHKSAYEKALRAALPKKPPLVLTCAYCAGTFESVRPRTYCSTPCGKSARGRNHRTRARKFGVYYTPFPVVDIYDRDGWRCHLCNKRVRRTRRWHSDPQGASLDHLIPLSLGGTHTPDNVALAHFGCNVRKGAGDAADQLLLIG